MTEKNSQPPRAANHVIKIENGTMQFVHADELEPLAALGSAATVRVSHVEPHPTKRGWLADMRPTGGPVLGSNGDAWTKMPDGVCVEWAVDTPERLVPLEPFHTRQAALDAEREWLARERGL